MLFTVCLLGQVPPPHGSPFQIGMQCSRFTDENPESHRGCHKATALELAKKSWDLNPG